MVFLWRSSFIILEDEVEFIEVDFEDELVEDLYFLLDFEFKLGLEFMFFK